MSCWLPLRGCAILLPFAAEMLHFACFCRGSGVFYWLPLSGCSILLAPAVRVLHFAAPPCEITYFAGVRRAGASFCWLPPRGCLNLLAPAADTLHFTGFPREGVSFCGLTLWGYCNLYASSGTVSTLGFDGLCRCLWRLRHQGYIAGNPRRSLLRGREIFSMLPLKI